MPDMVFAKRLAERLLAQHMHCYEAAIKEAQDIKNIATDASMQTQYDQVIEYITALWVGVSHDSDGGET